MLILKLYKQNKLKMEKRNCLNPDCGKEFAPNHGKQKYCSDRCKVHYSRLKKDNPPAFKDGMNKNNANGVLVLPKKSVEAKFIKATIEAQKNIEWIKIVEDYCNQQGCTPEDLIEAHKNKNKRISFSSIKPKKEKDKVIPGERYDRRKKMIGI